MLSRDQIFKLRVDTAKLCRFDIARLAVSIPIRSEKNLPGVYIRTHGNTVILSEELIQDYEYEDIVYAFVHALSGILLRHERRMGMHALTASDRSVWCLASEVCRSSFVRILFPFGVRPRQLNFLQFDDIRDVVTNVKEDSCVEDLYYALMEAGKEYSELPQCLSTLGGEGDGDPSTNSGEELDPIEDAMLDSTVEETMQMVAKRFLETMFRGIASAHGEFQYFIAEYYPEFNKDVSRIRAFLRSASGRGSGRYREGERPRRRNPTQIKLKQVDRMSFGRVAVIADVSGSTAEHRARLFQGLTAAVKACDRIDVFIGDTAILTELVGVRSAGQIKGLNDGGGTDMAAIMQEVDRRGYHSIVVITDGHTPWPPAKLKGDTYYFPFGDFTLKGVPEWIKIV